MRLALLEADDFEVVVLDQLHHAGTTEGPAAFIGVLVGFKADIERPHRQDGFGDDGTVVIAQVKFPDLAGSLVADIQHGTVAAHKQAAHLAEGGSSTHSVHDGTDVCGLGTACDRDNGIVIPGGAFPDPADAVPVSHIDVAVGGNGQVCEIRGEFCGKRAAFRPVVKGFCIQDTGDGRVTAGRRIHLQHLAAVCGYDQITVGVEGHCVGPLAQVDGQGRTGRQISSGILVYGVLVTYGHIGVSIGIEGDIHHAFSAPITLGGYLCNRLRTGIESVHLGFGFFCEPHFPVVIGSQPGDVIGVAVGNGSRNRSGLQIPDADRLGLFQDGRFLVGFRPYHAADGAEDSRRLVSARLVGYGVLDSGLAEQRGHGVGRFQVGIVDGRHRLDVGSFNPHVACRTSRSGDGITRTVHQINVDLGISMVVTGTHGQRDIEYPVRGGSGREGLADEAVVSGIGLYVRAVRRETAVPSLYG